MMSVVQTRIRSKVHVESRNFTGSPSKDRPIETIENTLFKKLQVVCFFGSVCYMNKQMFFLLFTWPQVKVVAQKFRRKGKESTYK